MLRFFEPEFELCWPISDSSPDHYEFSRMPFRSSSFITNSTGSSSSEYRLGGSSDVSSEIERFDSINGDFQNILSQDCNSFQFESIFSTPPPFNPIPGQASRLLISSHQNAMDNMKKQKKSLAIGDQIINEQTITRRECKRIKTAHESKFQTSVDAATSMKALSTAVKKSQKMGEKITSLQQLVSPFGKTDTASVLQEAAAYIKVLHEQIRVLSTPYFGAQTSSVLQGKEGEKISLKGRGLCVAPISSTIMNLTDHQEPFDRYTP